MGIFRKIGNNIIRSLCNLYVGNTLAQESMQVSGGSRVAVDATSVIRAAAGEGIVLLKNEGVLPLKPTDKVAIFGRNQIDWFYMGFGSGGDVNAPYTVNLLDAAKGRIDYLPSLAARYQKWCSSFANSADKGFWSKWPRYNPEMPISDADIAAYSTACDVAIVTFGRATGEDRENITKPGGYYLTKGEQTLLKRVTNHFKKTIVVLDIGSTIDMEWVKTYSVDAILIAYFGGQESCPALVDVLTGATNPCGKLPDSIARRYADYPSSANYGTLVTNYVEDIYVGYRYFETFCPHHVLYPFGFGLSYTTFDISVQSATLQGDKVTIEAKVTNTGNCAGKEVVQLYVAPPQGLLGKSVRSLVAFAKTHLLAAGDSQVLTLSCDLYDCASYDDIGVTGHRNCYVLEAGTYDFYVGNSVRCDLVAYSFALDAVRVIRELGEVLPVAASFDRLVPQLENGHFVEARQAIPLPTQDLRTRILQSLPQALPVDARSLSWQDVLDGRATIPQFVSTLSPEELEALTRGHGFMNSPLGYEGNGGAFGGLIPSLQQKGVPAVTVCDSSSGLRLKAYCNLFPAAVALAASWNVDLIQEVGRYLGMETAAHDVGVLLAPGINIHRNPLCGRNFEYMSEDPLLGGYMAAAYVRGVQSQGVGTSLKHFACNNQEPYRNRTDACVSLRALREIYLKGFEICVRTCSPWTVMTSYNKINGVWSHYNYDLVHILRDEWGYDGLVITDWWMQHDVSHEFPSIRDNAYRVRAQVDVYMPGSYSRVDRTYRVDSSLLSTLGAPDGITLGEIQRCAIHTLQFVLRYTKR